MPLIVTRLEQAYQSLDTSLGSFVVPYPFLTFFLGINNSIQEYCPITESLT